VAPAHPHLDRHRHLHRFHRRFHQPHRQRHFAHQRAARQLADNLAHRAAEIDVDNRRAIAFLKLGRLRHAGRIAANQLHRHRFFNPVPRGFLQGLASFADRRLARDHFGDV